MSLAGQTSERALILAPAGRDAQVAAGVLKEADLPSCICADVGALVAEMARGAGLAVVAAEAMRSANLKPLSDWLANQSSWSDFPFLVLVPRGGGVERNPETARLSEILGNVSFVERPFHPTTLISAVRSAVRARRRQYEARERMQELHDREEQLRIAQQAGAVGSFEILPDSGIVLLSDEFRRLWGLKPTATYSRSDLRKLMVDSDGFPADEDWPPLTDAALQYKEFQIRRPSDGQVRWMARRGESIYDPEKKRQRYLGVSFDVTERRQAVDSLREINETLESRVEERARALETAQEQLRQSQKMEAIGQLTGGIAHDFNNLLQGITGSLSILQRRIAQGRVTALEPLITGAMASATRAAALTHRLLAFARRQPLDPKALEVNPLINSMEDLLRRSLAERIKLEFKLSDGLWLTRCDPNQLESAILNLCINARDAMPDGGTMTVATSNIHVDTTRDDQALPGPYVCISVTDTGVGMDAVTMERAFDPFFTTKPLGQGTGLGLSMIYGFARQSEGFTRISSDVGKGTTVQLYLPRFDGEVRREPAPTPVLAEAEHGDTVLVVEDDPIVRGLIVNVLNELSYRALEASDGPSGLRILQSDEAINLLVTDIGLPGLNGRQVADAGRQRNPDLKVLFITGYAENAAAAEGFLEPGMAMLTKPFPIETLATKIKDMIGT